MLRTGNFYVRKAITSARNDEASSIIAERKYWLLARCACPAILNVLQFISRLDRDQNGKVSVALFGPSTPNSQQAGCRDRREISIERETRECDAIIIMFSFASNHWTHRKVIRFFLFSSSQSLRHNDSYHDLAACRTQYCDRNNIVYHAHRLLGMETNNLIWKREKENLWFV